MTLASSTLQIRRHEYSGDLNIVIFVGICILSFYAINMDDMSWTLRLKDLNIQRALDNAYGSAIKEAIASTMRVFCF
ncbi:transmembrane protein, putative [Medicago truncatula]|uniref:Transmembrane protein, putative n=1 Tax=Medicago truncatula TaxID=3880 RepID=A0A072U805_MEDTR|nr:transmembrane protein, putative [Medicago truncatula]